ncbi:hypothetical protein Anas_04356 [Armadillidium nasatum]|uniref:Uncharacterized protein n=1 Tax=Armadillidium nasatum TaxID=96803 RepID=A0A5N5TPP6_9CRUS|nr:hypothetical protein Anas_04356 [Armadillidium nasatum]
MQKIFRPWKRILK